MYDDLSPAELSQKLNAVICRMVKQHFASTPDAAKAQPDPQAAPSLNIKNEKIKTRGVLCLH